MTTGGTSTVVWNDTAWNAFCGLVEEAWPGEFDTDTRAKWRVLLDGTDPDLMVTGLKRLLHEGWKWRPSASLFLEAANRDPSAPTFDEAFRLIYGRNGVLRVPSPRQYANDADQRRQRDAAIEARLENVHPLVGSFVRRQGIGRLLTIQIHHETYGEKERRDLRLAWGQHVEAMRGRNIAALAAGRRKGELGAFDPLTALAPGHRAALETGEAA